MNNQKTTTFDLIKTAFESQHLPAIASGQQTDSPAFSYIGQLSRHTKNSIQIQEIVTSIFPSDYAGDTLEQLEDKVQRILEMRNVGGTAGDESDEDDDDLANSDPGTPSQAQQLLELFSFKGHTLFHDQFYRVFVDFADSDTRKTLPLRSVLSKRYLQYDYRHAYGRPIASQPFNQVLDVLEGEALFGSPTIKAYLRVAPTENGVVINLADDSNNVAIVTSEGYEITTYSPIKFVRSGIIDSLPHPKKHRPDILKELQDLLGLEDQTFIRMIAFLVNCYKPNGPYFCLLTEGEQGSGKSLLTELIKTLIDPSKAPKIRMPDNERDLMIQAKDSTVLLFDNISSVKKDISDSLCSLATGGGFSTRKLYTDDEQAFFNESRPFICNGIKGIASRADLLERAIFIQLPPMAIGKRKPERFIREKFRELWPEVLDKIFHIISAAIRNLNNVEAPTNIRMADAAQWILAAETEIGFAPGAILASLKDSQEEIIFDSLANNALVIALLKVAERGAFEGTVGELMQALNEVRNSSRDRFFPSTPAHLSKELALLRPELPKIGLELNFEPKRRDGRRIYLRLIDPDLIVSQTPPGAIGV